MNKKLSGSSLCFRSVLAVSIAAAIPVFAAAQEGSVLEEVVVTAEHRTASVQDTQISISALSADDIQQLGISNGADIGQIAPNVTITNFIGGRTGFGVNIRGVGNNETLITFDPAVGMYIDDVLISKNTGGLVDVLDMERIEVLRGPQGTLYGRNTMGGAVNIITKKPGDEFEGSVKTTLGNYGQRDLRGMLNVPLAGADSSMGPLNMRVSAATLNRDGLQQNKDSVLGPAPQSELGTKDRDVGMLQLLWQPTDRTEVMYSYDLTRIDEVPEVPWVTIANPARPAGPLVTPYLAQQNERPDSIQINGVGIAETEIDGHSLHVDFDITDAMTFKSITALRDMENLGQADSDGTPINFIITVDEQAHDFFSQEFRLLGAALDTRLDYSVGLFYMDESGDVSNGTAVSGALGKTLADFANESWALYGQVNFALTDKWALTGGVRYTEEDRDMSKSTLSAAGVRVNFPDASASYDNISPMASLSYHWSDDIMTYAKISTGFQSGGFNVRETTFVDFTRGFDEETLMAYEAGIKSTFNDRVRVNASFWFSDYDDKRINMFNPETLGNTVRNAGVVEIYGAEVEAVVQLTDNLQLGANYGYVHPEFVEYDALQSNGTVLDLSKTTNFPYTPENDISANLTYEHPVDFGLVRARLDWSYKDERTFLAAQPERNSGDAYDLWNARLTLDELVGPGASTVRVSAWGKNLTDESYWNFGVNLFSTFGFDFNTYGEPRTFGVDVVVDF